MGRNYQEAEPAVSYYTLSFTSGGVRVGMFWNLNPVAAAQLCSKKAPYFGSTGLNSQTFPLSHHLLALSALPPAALCLLKLHKKVAGRVCISIDKGRILYFRI